MKNLPIITLQQFEDSVNHIFQCQQKKASLELQKASIDAEAILIQHLVKALNIIDGGKV